MAAGRVRPTGKSDPRLRTVIRARFSGDDNGSRRKCDKLRGEEVDVQFGHAAIEPNPIVFFESRGEGLRENQSSAHANPLLTHFPLVPSRGCDQNPWMKKPKKKQRKLLKAIGKADPQGVREAIGMGADPNQSVVAHLNHLAEKDISLSMRIIGAKLGNYLHFALWNLSHLSGDLREKYVEIVRCLVESGAEPVMNAERRVTAEDILCADCLNPGLRRELAERCGIAPIAGAGYRWFDPPGITTPDPFPESYPLFEDMVERWKEVAPSSYIRSNHGDFAAKVERGLGLQFPDAVRQWCAAQPRWSLPLHECDHSAFGPRYEILRQELPGQPPAFFYKIGALAKDDEDDLGAGAEMWVALGGDDDDDPEILWGTESPEESENPVCLYRHWQGYWTNRDILRPSGVRFAEFARCHFADHLTLSARKGHANLQIDGVLPDSDLLERTAGKLDHYGSYTNPRGVTGHRFYGKRACVTILVGERMSRASAWQRAGAQGQTPGRAGEIGVGLLGRKMAAGVGLDAGKAPNLGFLRDKLAGERVCLQRCSSH